MTSVSLCYKPVFPPDSQHFEVIPFASNRERVAPGCEVAYTVRFKPDSRSDYSYDLCVVTEREKFVVPIRASGCHALLDLPDVIDFGGECPVRYESSKTILMRNIGEKATRFWFKVPTPYSVSLTDLRLVGVLTKIIRVHRTLCKKRSK